MISERDFGDSGDITLVQVTKLIYQCGDRGHSLAVTIFQMYERYIFSSGKPELWTPRMYTRSRRREKNEFGISRGYISIILIYFEGFHENVEILKKLLKKPEIYTKFQKYGNSKLQINTSVLMSVVFLPLPTHTNHWTRVHSS